MERKVGCECDTTLNLNELEEHLISIKHSVNSKIVQKKEYNKESYERNKDRTKYCSKCYKSDIPITLFNIETSLCKSYEGILLITNQLCICFKKVKHTLLFDTNQLNNCYFCSYSNIIKIDEVNFMYCPLCRKYILLYYSFS